MEVAKPVKFRASTQFGDYPVL